MNFTNQTTAVLRKIAIVTGLATVLGLVSAASASVALLSGGDPGEGYSPAFNLAYAYNIGTSFDTGLTAAQSTVQGVLFTGWDWGGGTNVPAPGDSNVTLTLAATAFGLPPINYGAGLNDKAMSNLLTTGVFAGTPVLTLGGLSPTQSYQVDMFVETNNDTRTEDFTFTGATVATDSFDATAGNGYDVSETLQPDISGKIVVTLSGVNNPFFNAFSVTSAPEPASLGFLAAGGLLLLRRRRSMR